MHTADAVIGIVRSSCDGENVSDTIVRDYRKHLLEAVQDAAQHLPLRTIKNTRVETVLVNEIKDDLMRDFKP